MHNCISKFLKKYKPGENLQKPDEEILHFGRQMLPKEIVELWEDHNHTNRRSFRPVRLHWKICMV